jgi:hypothetical protein
MASCKHSQNGLCKACSESKPYYQFKYCKKQCFACKECGYFYGPGAHESLQGKPVVFMPLPEKTLYTAESVRAALAPKWNTYFAKLAVGQTSTWKCDQRTGELFCLSQWIMDELIGLSCPDVDRRDVQAFFNRKSRAENDLYEVAARAMNTFVEGKIERYRGR